MKLVYITNSRIPTEKAHGIQIMKMCEAFADNGNDVTLLVPDRRNWIEQDPFLFYGVRKNFEIQYIPTLDSVFLGRFGFILQSVTFAISARMKVSKFSPDVVYGRDEYSLCAITCTTRLRCVYEVHMGRWNILVKALMNRVEKIVSISNGLKRYYIDRGVDTKKIIVAPDAVDIQNFSLSISSEEARTKLGLPQDKKLIVYTGHLYDWKGVDTLVEIAKKISTDKHLVVVGGLSQDVERCEKKTRGVSTVTFLGKKPYVDMPLYLSAADVLLIPNSGKFEISRTHTSPMKLFEYMVAERPIVCSDLPSLREIVSEEEVFFAEPDNAESFNQKINEAVYDTKTAHNRVQSASKLVRERYTWVERAREVLLGFKLTFVK